MGANYIEANDNLGAGDLKLRIRICKKECKESIYWLKHTMTYSDEVLERERFLLMEEATELMRIFAAILKRLISNENDPVRI